MAYLGKYPWLKFSVSMTPSILSRVSLLLFRLCRMTAYTPNTSRFARGCASMSFVSMPVFETESVSNTSLKRQLAYNEKPVDLNSDNSLVMIEPRQRGVFPCKVTAPWRNVKCRYTCGRSACRQPSTNFLVPPKLGYSVCAL